MFNLISQLLNKNKGNYDAFVLKGFDNQSLKELTKTYSHPLGELPLNKDEQLDLKLISESFTGLFAGLSKATPSQPCILDFESFIQLGKNLNLDQIGKKFLVVENNLLDEYPNQSSETAEDFERLMNREEEIPETQLFHQYYSNASEYEEGLLVQYMDGLVEDFSSVSKVKLFQPESPRIIQAEPNRKQEVDFEFQFQPLSMAYLKYKLNLNQGKEPKETRIWVDSILKRQKDAVKELELLAGAISQLGIKATFYSYDERLRNNARPELTALLKTYWGSENFRTLNVYEDPDINKSLIHISQAAVVEEAITQFENGQKDQTVKDIFLTAPTGAGKSLLFQLPAIYLAKEYNAVTIVISPLIALMKDQVEALKNDRGYLNVAYINSELSLIDREDVLDRVHKGEISILYLSPELLLSYELSTFIGERELGLLVVDEAHLVTTWGRDFRVDYWYLGNYVRKIRKYYPYKFTVMAVTATAVYGGPNDMAFETLDSLSMENALMYIGKVRRENIDFDIQQTRISSSHEREKLELSARRIEELINDGKKSIIYCPWTNQLTQIRDQVDNDYRGAVGRYYGGLEKEIKTETYEKFKNNEIKTIVSTKAFGMGVDIDDITCVYHHAPSGHLADYVQEIGRLARKENRGIAKIDFNKKDLKYTKILYGLSSIKQYQVQMVLDKILKIHQLKKKRNLVVSVDDFQHIFNFENTDVEQKVKSSLLLLEKDLISKYQYNVLIARPKSLYTTVFARIYTDQEGDFLKKFGSMSKNIHDRDIEEKGMKVFSIELDKVWEHYHSDKSFPLTKKEYFEKTLFEDDGIYVSPQLRMVFNLHESSKEVFEKLTSKFGVVENTLAEMGGGFFTKTQFTKALQPKLGNRILAKRISDLILAIYASPVIVKGRRQDFAKGECFIQLRRSGNDLHYRVIQRSYPKIKSRMRKRFHRMFGNMHPEARECKFFIPANEEKNIGMIQMAYILEAFDLATFEIGGGEKPGVFIRLNDPVKLKRILERGYTNQILREVDRRQQTSVKIMEYFFTNPMTSEERWEFIENYFLGTEAEELLGESEIFEINE